MLTDALVRATKPADRPKKLFDKKGLFLLVTPSGGKLWRFRYRFGGKEKLLTFKNYPAVSLQQARQFCASNANWLRRSVLPQARSGAWSVNAASSSSPRLNTAVPS
jgi:hypothetical protein